MKHALGPVFSFEVLPACSHGSLECRSGEIPDGFAQFLDRMRAERCEKVVKAASWLNCGGWALCLKERFVWPGIIFWVSDTVCLAK